MKKENKSKRFKMKRILAVAASVLVIISIGLLLNDRGDHNQIKPIAEVIYPKAYAFDDYENWRKIVDENPVDLTTTSVINDFAYKTSPLIIGSSEENVNYSPLSLYYALGLATTGSKGHTQMELLDLLGMPDSQVLSEQSGNLYRSLYKENEVGQLKIANSIWLANEINGEPLIFKDAFVDNAINNFYASSYNVDFSHKETGKAMSDWISDNTKETLSPTIETNPEQILSIINTIYFYDQWINRFNVDNTIEDTFYLLKGGEVKADFMNQSMGSAGFSKGDNFTRAGLQLKNGGEMAYISDIQQETHISIDEEGVEASAFTQIDYTGSAMPEGRADMILNRPFIYGITASNGSLLFIGICMNPLY